LLKDLEDFITRKISNLRQSRGSLDETLEYMITAYDEKYITKNILSEINKDYKDCLKQLNGYIKYLKTAKQEVKTINNK